MKRGVILAIEVAVLIAVLQSSFVQFFLQDIQEQVTDILLDISNYAESQELNELRQSMAPHVTTLTQSQKDYLADITQSKDKLQKFNSDYCLGNDKNPFVYGTTLKVFCGQIQSSKILTKT